MQKVSKKDLIGIFEEIKKVMVENKEKLTKLDSVIGDGDLGITMSEGFTQVFDNFKSLEEENTIGNFLMKTGFCMANKVPSTMGTLVATGIMKSGTSLRKKEYIEVSDILNMFKDAIAGIEKRGKAKRGEKTLLDAFYPAMEEAERGVNSSKDIITICKLAYEGAKKGVEETKAIQSVHGKAACYGEKTIGHQDPGATVIMYIFEGIHTYMKNFSELSVNKV